jgi:hypothetical protein
MAGLGTGLGIVKFNKDIINNINEVIPTEGGHLSMIIEDKFDI